MCQDLNLSFLFLRASSGILPKLEEFPILIQPNFLEKRFKPRFKAEAVYIFNDFYIVKPVIVFFVCLFH